MSLPREKLAETFARTGVPVRTDCAFSSLTTLRVGGEIKLTVRPQNKRQLVACLRLLWKLGEQYIVVGNGSNILANDGFFDGVAVVTKDVNAVRIRGNVVTVDCGTNTAKNFCFARFFGPWRRRVSRVYSVNRRRRGTRKRRLFRAGCRFCRSIRYRSNRQRTIVHANRRRMRIFKARQHFQAQRLDSIVGKNALYSVNDAKCPTKICRNARKKSCHATARSSVGRQYVVSSAVFAVSHAGQTGFQGYARGRSGSVKKARGFRLKH